MWAEVSGETGFAAIGAKPDAPGVGKDNAPWRSAVLDGKREIDKQDGIVLNHRDAQSAWRSVARALNEHLMERVIAMSGRNADNNGFLIAERETFGHCPADFEVEWAAEGCVHGCAFGVRRDAGDGFARGGEA